MSNAKSVLIRDLVIFQLKLALDGLKDLVLSPVSLGAAALDILSPGARPGHRFYAVMTLGERFDRWLNLFGAAEQADASEDGLFGRSRAGSNALAGWLEELALGRKEPEEGQATGTRSAA
ncbi:MAG TPA: hypothetical protein VFZ69_11130 [Longimicrobiales bacterium]